MWYLKYLFLPSSLASNVPKVQLNPYTYITIVFACKESVLTVFFDLEKAYDTNWRYHILHQLSSIDISGSTGFSSNTFFATLPFEKKLPLLIPPHFIIAKVYSKAVC